MLAISAAEIATMSARYGVDFTGQATAVEALGWDLAAVAAAYEDWSNDGMRPEFDYSTLGGLVSVRHGVVPVAAVAKNSVDQLFSDLTSLGLSHAASAGLSVSGFLPAGALTELSRLESLAFARPALRPDVDIGDATSQGDVSMRSTDARTRFSINGVALDGSGVSVGVMSDSFNFLNGEDADIASGDLPGINNPNGYTTPVTVVAEPLFNPMPGDEGRALAQIVHDVAPGATMVFHVVEDAGFFPGAVNTLRNTHGVDVIVDDYSFRVEPMFQDGIVAQAVDAAVHPEPSGDGIPYFTSAGNSGANGYQATFNASSVNSICGDGIAHDFDPGPGEDYLQGITVQEGTKITISFQWDEAFKSVSGGNGAESNFNICLADENGTLHVVYDGGSNPSLGEDPSELIVFTNPQNSGETEFNIIISHAAGSAEHEVKYVIRRAEGFGFSITHPPASNTSTVYSHNNAAGVGSVGAVFYHYGPAFPPPNPPFPGFEQPLLGKRSPHPFCGD